MIRPVITLLHSSELKLISTEQPEVFIVNAHFVPDFPMTIKVISDTHCITKTAYGHHIFTDFNPNEALYKIKDHYNKVIKIQQTHLNAEHKLNNTNLEAVWQDNMNHMYKLAKTAEEAQQEYQRKTTALLSGFNDLLAAIQNNR